VFVVFGLWFESVVWVTVVVGGRAGGRNFWGQQQQKDGMAIANAGERAQQPRAEGHNEDE
jgi:hypothetical protein